MSLLCQYSAYKYVQLFGNMRSESRKIIKLSIDDSVDDGSGDEDEAAVDPHEGVPGADSVAGKEEEGVVKAGPVSEPHSLVEQVLAEEHVVVLSDPALLGGVDSVNDVLHDNEVPAAADHVDVEDQKNTSLKILRVILIVSLILR